MRATQTSCGHSMLSTPPDTTCLTTQNTLPATHPALQLTVRIIAKTTAKYEHSISA